MKKKCFVFALFFLILSLSACSRPSSQNLQEEISADKGRYLSIIGGCHDCHTPEWVVKPFKIPEADWLVGSGIGYHGPWGTTYPTNLRIFVNGMSEEAWVQFAKKFMTRPPMPWWILHELSEADSRSFYRFMKKLGPAGKAAPDFVPANQKPQTPIMEFFPHEPREK